MIGTMGDRPAVFRPIAAKELFIRSAKAKTRPRRSGSVWATRKPARAAAAEPGARPFASVGDVVKKGQVLCIIEAMKLMNEIKSDCDGEVASVYVQNGQAVQFGERLFAVKVK